MSRRLLEMCLLAYPRARRQRDREYLRDLSLDLAEAHGLARQAISLLMGGFRERIEACRRNLGDGLGKWARRAAVACIALIALTVAANALFGVSGGNGGSVHELEEYACVNAENSPSSPNGLRFTSASGCAETRRLVAAREREGWNCATRGTMGAGRPPTTWECTRG